MNTIFYCESCKTYKKPKENTKDGNFCVECDTELYPGNQQPDF